MIYIYIYIYIERERERCIYTHMCLFMFLRMLISWETERCLCQYPNNFGKYLYFCFSFYSGEKSIFQESAGLYKCVYKYMCVCVCVFMYKNHHHHHQVTMTTRIFSSLSHQLSLSSIALRKLPRLYPVSVHS